MPFIQFGRNNNQSQGGHFIEDTDLLNTPDFTTSHFIILLFLVIMRLNLFLDTALIKSLRNHIRALIQFPLKRNHL